MRNFSLLLSFIYCFVFASVSDQNTVAIKWQLSTKKNQSNEYELTATATVPPGKFIYLSAPAETGIESPNTSFSDSSIKAASVSTEKGIRTYKDALFDGAEVQIAEKEIVFNCFFAMGHHYMIIFLLFALVVLENTGFVGFTSVFERYFALFVVDELNLVFFA